MLKAINLYLERQNASCLDQPLSIQDIRLAAPAPVPHKRGKSLIEQSLDICSQRQQDGHDQELLSQKVHKLVEAVLQEQVAKEEGNQATTVGFEVKEEEKVEEEEPEVLLLYILVFSVIAAIYKMVRSIQWELYLRTRYVCMLHSSTLRFLYL